MLMNKYLFGPVPSRRLGISLGIDLVPLKTCTFDCVYCECGRTTQKTLKRKEYVSTDAVIEELEDFLKTKPELDYITFSGSGEPLLNSQIQRIISYIKTHYPQYKIALITNSSLFYDKSIVKNVLEVDVIMPSLDCVSQEVFYRINRPIKGLFMDQIIDGLLELTKQFKGQIYLEIFIVPGLNDTQEELRLIVEKTKLIDPDEVQLNYLDRPGTEAWVRSPDPNELKPIIDCFKGLPVKSIEHFQSRNKVPSYSSNIEDRILTTIKRRPCTVEDLSQFLNINRIEINKYIQLLLDKNLIKTQTLDRGVFILIK